MNTTCPGGGRCIKKSDNFTGVRWPLLCILLINLVILEDTALSDNMVFLREGQDCVYLYCIYDSVLDSYEEQEF